MTQTPPTTIDDYINGLPTDLYALDLFGAGLTHVPDLRRFTNMRRLDVAVRIPISDKFKVFLLDY